MGYLDIKMEILHASAVEHFKAEKDLSQFLELNHPKRIKLQKESNKISEQLRVLNKEKEKTNSSELVLFK